MGKGKHRNAVMSRSDIPYAQRMAARLTYTTAKKLLDPGDVVYIPKGGRIVECAIQSIDHDHVVTKEDCLFFDEVGGVWFLTKRGATDALNIKHRRN